MFCAWSQNRPDRVVKRKTRTKDACATCRRRKVRCDERRPKCGHCDRLALDCQWQDRPGAAPRGGSLGRTSVREQSPPSTIADIQQVGEQDLVSNAAIRDQNARDFSLNDESYNSIVDLDLNQTFDYASFMWDGTDLVRRQPDEIVPLSAPYAGTHTMPHHAADDQETHVSDAMTWPSPSTPLNETELLDMFGRTNAPPMLMHIEARPRWSAMRKMLMSMASSSSMVRNAVLAYTSLQIQEYSQRRAGHNGHYELAKNSLFDRLSNTADGADIPSRELALLLAVFFLLTYMDLVSDRSAFAQELLTKAHILVKSCDGDDLSSLHRRIVSWLRLLDGRAVSAGGDGHFLAENGYDSSSLDYTSPHDDDHTGEDPDDIQEALLDALSSPGFAFFHKVQSFMGRISQIDPWHRSRGTVEDETQVMSIATKINRDLVKLYQQRPPLIDLAAEGKLCEPYLQPQLAANVTRSLRTYLANYHASFIHLHRVAYKHLPRTQSVVDAIQKIQQIAHTMREPHGGLEESLPVNMLWPLLMWGCEEDISEMRTWILREIRRMGNIATNAGTTADVLEELQRRQDATGQRMDVRSIMQEVFNSNFAVV
jgi:hypothetical protein